MVTLSRFLSSIRSRLTVFAGGCPSQFSIGTSSLTYSIRSLATSLTCSAESLSKTTSSYNSRPSWPMSSPSTPGPLKSFGELFCIRENSVIPSFCILIPCTTMPINGGAERGLSTSSLLNGLNSYGNGTVACWFTPSKLAIVLNGLSPSIACSVTGSVPTDACVSIASSISLRSLMENYSAFLKNLTTAAFAKLQRNRLLP